MGRWNRDWVPLAGGLILVGGAVAGAAWAYGLPLAERNNALGFWGFVLALAGVLIPVLVWLGRGRRPPGRRSVDAVVTSFAQAVYGQWRKAADERQLLIPAPIPIRWSLSDLAVAGPVAAAVDTPGMPPVFLPLPGQAAITEADLRAGGGRRELHQVFAGLASGRIVVVGDSGAGKSGGAILLLLDTLAHRDSLEDAARARVPVPVLFTGLGWDPNTRSVQDWLVDQLVATYPMFQHRGDPAEAAELVAARDKVALILDGLDEMDEALRPAALQALSKAPFRVVVLTRSQEMVRAAAEAWLVGAVAVHLQDVTGPEAANYLERARTRPSLAGWAELLTCLRQHPDGTLARGLSTPLTLTLLRDTYQAGDDVHDLLDATRYRTSDDLEQHLIASVLPAAYARRAGGPAPRYTEQQARQTLSFIARQMGQDRDLAWWHIPHWAPATPRILATKLVYGLGAGLAFGLTGGLAFEPVGGLVCGPVSGVVFGLLLGRAGGLGFGGPRQVRAANWRAAISRRVLGKLTYKLYWPAGGVVVGLAVGLVVGISRVELAVGLLASGLGYGLLLWLVFGLGDGLTEGATGEGKPTGPRETWRNDRMVGLVYGPLGGLVYGPVGGLVVVVVFVFGGGLVYGLIGGLGCMLVFGLVFGLMSSDTWTTTLAWLQLRRFGQVAAVGLMPFLEDARERGVLRTVGAVYQFRHATLQDYLATQATSSSAASSAVPRASTAR